MTPLPCNPAVVVQLNEDGDVIATATNVSPGLNVDVVYTDVSFKALACNMPFDSTRPFGN